MNDCAPDYVQKLRGHSTSWVEVPQYNGQGRVHARFSSNASVAYKGVVLEGYEYRRFQEGASPVWAPLRFPGQYHDAETDLFENWNRYYDPSIGRYLGADPVASQPRTHLKHAHEGRAFPGYTYAYSNPLRFADPDGLEPPSSVMDRRADAALAAVNKCEHGDRAACGLVATAAVATAGAVVATGAAIVMTMSPVAAVTTAATSSPVVSKIATSPQAQKTIEVTETAIRQAMQSAPLQTQQSAISLPMVQRYVQMLQQGMRAPAINVDNGIIVDGNHRYVAARLLGQEPEIREWVGGNASRVIDWAKVFIDPKDWSLR